MEVFEATVTLVRSKFRLVLSGSRIETVGLPVAGGVVEVERKPVPVMVTDFSAALLAEVGEIALTVGAGLFSVNAVVFDANCESGLVTFISYCPLALSAGIEAVISVELVTLMFVADIVSFPDASRVTSVVPVVTKLVPTMVILIVLSFVPELGETDVMVGAGNVT